MPAFPSQHVIPIHILFWFSALILIIQHLRISFLLDYSQIIHVFFKHAVKLASEQGEGKERGRGFLLLLYINITSGALFTGYCKASPQNKDVEKLSGQLKFKVTGLRPRLHKLANVLICLSYPCIQVLFR